MTALQRLSSLQRSTARLSTRTSRRNSHASSRDEFASKRRKTPFNSSVVKSSKHLKKRRKKKQRVIEKFLQNTSKVSQWHDRQINIVREARIYETIIQSFTKRSKVNILEESSQKYSKSENDLVVIEIKLAVLANDSLKNETLQKSFSYFQAFPFLLWTTWTKRNVIRKNRSNHAACLLLSRDESQKTAQSSSQDESSYS